MDGIFYHAVAKQDLERVLVEGLLPNSDNPEGIRDAVWLEEDPTRALITAYEMDSIRVTVGEIHEVAPEYAAIQVIRPRFMVGTLGRQCHTHEPIEPKYIVPHQFVSAEHIRKLVEGRQE